MRFVEIVLLATPFLVFALWRVMAPASRPPRSLVVGVAVGALVMGALLLLLRFEEAAAPDAAYVPSHIEDGRVIPGHAAPPPEGAPR